MRRLKHPTCSALSQAIPAVGIFGRLQPSLNLYTSRQRQALANDIHENSLFRRLSCASYFLCAQSPSRDIDGSDIGYGWLCLPVASNIRLASIGRGGSQCGSRCEGCGAGHQDRSAAGRASDPGCHTHVGSPRLDSQAARSLWPGRVGPVGPKTPSQLRSRAHGCRSSSGMYTSSSAAF